MIRRAALGWLPSMLAAVLVLSGCATTLPSTGPVIAGRLSVQVDATAAEPARALSASFELRGDAERGELDLTSPLGNVVARARWQPGSAELLSGEGGTRFADLNELSTRTFGEPLPLAALFDWLRGRPWPAAPSAPTSDSGFQQLGWLIDTARFADGQIVARRSAAPAVTLRAKVELPS